MCYLLLYFPIIDSCNCAVHSITIVPITLAILLVLFILLFHSFLYHCTSASYTIVLVAVLLFIQWLLYYSASDTSQPARDVQQTSSEGSLKFLTAGISRGPSRVS